MLPLTALVRPRKDVLFREVAGEAVLLDLASGTYFGLNQTGARMWAAVTSQPTLVDALAVLAAEYEASSEQLQADLLALIEELVARELVAIDAP